MAHEWSSFWDESKKITSVQETEKGYNLGRGSWMFYAPKELMGDVVPKVGDMMQLETTKNSSVRGMKLNGQLVYHKTDEQLDQERAEALQKIKEEIHAEFIAYEKHAAEDYNSLHKCLRTEIDNLREQGQERREQWEPYIMFTLKEAMIIADTLKTPKAIQSFQKASYERRQELVPILSDSHTGHTFGVACSCAYKVAQERQKEVTAAHRFLGRGRK